jgi:hypothetical protein
MCDYKVTREDWIMDPRDPAQCPEFDAAANVKAVLTNITELHRAMRREVLNLYFDPRYMESGLEMYLATTGAMRRLLVEIPADAIVAGEDQFAKALVMTNERLAEVVRDSKEFYLLHKPKKEE